MAVNTPNEGSSGEHLRGLYPDETFPALEVMPEALIFTLGTFAGDVEGDAPSIRIPFIKADPAAAFVPEGAEIAENDPTLDELTIKTSKIAVLSRTSNEAVRHNPGSADILSTSLRRAVVTKGNAALLANEPLAGTPTGLFWTPNKSEGGELEGNLDAIENAIGLIETAGGTPTHIVAHPKDWALIRGLKSAADSNVPLLGAPAEQMERRLFGLDVIVTPSAKEKELLVTCKDSLYVAAGDLNIAMSNDMFFTRDSTAVRATWRIGWQVIDPKHVGTVSVP